MRVRMGSGALALASALSLSACGGDEPAELASTETAVSAGPTATSAQQVVVDPAAFKRPRAKREAVALDCLGNRVASVPSDRAPDPAAIPLENPDAATDGLAALVAVGVPEHTRAMNPGWDDSEPPLPVYLFPLSPAQSERAVVRFVTGSGDAVAAFIVARDVARGPWHVESSYWCSW